MKRILKWIGIVAGGLVVLLLLAVVGLSLSANARLNKAYDITPDPVAIPTDAASIEEGKRLASIYCTGCHGDDLGGADFFNDPSLAVVDAPNLTRGQGGVGEQYTDTDWVRAIRHGIDPEGKPLFIMPSGDFYHFSDEDLGQIIAYLKNTSPVNREANDRSTALPGRILLTLGAFGNVLNAETIDHTGLRPDAPAPGVTAEYGQYLVDTFGCRTCHGSQLAGGNDPNPDAPPGPNLTRGGNLGAWDEQTFLAMIRTRKSEWMPFEALGRMTDEELQAMWLYLQSLPALDTVAAR